MAEIKSYKPEHRQAVRQICLETGPNSALTDPKMREYILSAYCDYYIENEPQNAFVLTDDSEMAQGYILCAENFKAYSKAFRPYLKKILKTGFVNCLEAFGEYLAYAVYSKKYPSHLHIDLNSGFRGGGNGSKMIQMLLEKLKSNGSKGVMLIVGTGNVKAIKFYKKNGFKVLRRIGEGTVMAKELN